MLDVILDSLGAALLLGQAIHFFWFADVLTGELVDA